MTYTQWLATEYPAFPKPVLDYYRNAERSAFIANRSAPDPIWTNHAIYQMPAAMHLDLLYSTWPDQPNRNTPPSFIDNDTAHLPTRTLVFWSIIGFPLHSWVLDCWNGLEEPSDLKIKPRRSYWTGKPQHRRNLP